MKWLKNSSSPSIRRSKRGQSATVLVSLIVGLMTAGTLRAAETITVSRFGCAGLGFVKGVVASGDVDTEGICNYLKGNDRPDGFWPPRGPLNPRDECRLDGGKWIDGNCVLNTRPESMMEPRGGPRRVPEVRSTRPQNLEAVPIRYNGKRTLVFVERGATKTPGAAMPVIFSNRSDPNVMPVRPRTQ